MISPSPRLSLTASTSSESVTSYSDEDSDDDVRAPSRRRSQQQTTNYTTVTVGSVVVSEKATVPGVVNGDIHSTTWNFLLNPAKLPDDDASVNVDHLVKDAVKITSETVKSFIPSDKVTGTKEDVEGLSRRWCYLITALVILSVITLIGTAMLSFTNWGVLQNPPSPTEATIDGLSREEKRFASIVGPPLVTRTMWLAAPPREPMDINPLPVATVVVCHTASDFCNFQAECIERVKYTQRFHQWTRLWADIGYSFLIGGDGSVYWGRGFDFVGAHTKNHNNGTIGVAFIGTYISVVPNERQVKSFDKLIQMGVREGKITPDYTLVAQCQLKVTAAPGLALVNMMKSWPHFNTSLPILCTEG